MIVVARSEPERPPSQISAASVRPRRLHGGRLSEDQVSKLSRDIQITHRHMEVTVTTHLPLCWLSLSISVLTFDLSKQCRNMLIIKRKGSTQEGV